MKNLYSNLRMAVFILIPFALYGFAVNQMGKLPKTKNVDLLSVALPAAAQVFIFGGDRYLASNMAVFRALVLSSEAIDAPTAKILGQVQKDASILNPAHEDNYYVGQAVLPWAGEVEADKYIQSKATLARPWDALPPFFYGFGRFYFDHNPAEGAKSIELAAARSEGVNKDALTEMAARWYEKGDDPRTAIGMVNALAQSTRNEGLKQQLLLRVERLKNLGSLRDAVAKYKEKNGAPPDNLERLVEGGFLALLPIDPLGQGFTLDTTGVPIVAPTAKKK
jgi:hypothetical protein